MLLKIFFLLAIAIKKSQTAKKKVTIPKVTIAQSQPSCNIEFGSNINYSDSSKQKIASIYNMKSRKASKIDSIVLCDNFMKNDNVDKDVKPLIERPELDKAPFLYFHGYAFKCIPGTFKSTSVQPSPDETNKLNIIGLTGSDSKSPHQIYKKKYQKNSADLIMLGSDDCSDLKYIYYLYPDQKDDKELSSAHKQIAFFFNGAPDIYKFDFNTQNKVYSLNNDIIEESKAVPENSNNPPEEVSQETQTLITKTQDVQTKSVQASTDTSSQGNSSTLRSIRIL